MDSNRGFDHRHRLSFRPAHGDLLVGHRKSATPTPPKMITKRMSYAIVASIIAANSTLFSQTVPAEQPIILSPFEVRGELPSKYQAAEATSASRISVSLFDSPTSINVLTNDFVKDVGAGNVIDALKYASGVTQSTQPVGADRIQIRGFQTDGRVMDGFTTYSTLLHLDPAVIDHIELVKGPSAIIAPAGSPGGTASFAIKKPQFTKNFGSVTLQAGDYNANKAWIDINRRVSDNVAIRLVASAIRAKGYYGDFNHEWVLDPGVSFRFGSGNQVTIYAVFDHHTQQNYLGLPVDYAASSTHDTDVLSGVKRNANPYDVDNIRHEVRQDYFGTYTGRFTEDLNFRFAVHAMKNDARYAQFNQTPTTPVGSSNPFTGLYEPFVIWTQSGNVFTSAPSAIPNGMFNRASLTSKSPTTQYDVQNDYVYSLKREKFESTTTAGLAFNHVFIPNTAYPYTKPAYSIYGPYSFAPIANPAASPSQDIETTYSLVQVYVNENISLFKKKVILNGSVSNNTYHVKYFDILKFNAGNPVHVNAQTVHKKLYSAGVVIQPTKDISAYYSYGENAGFTPPGQQPGSTVEVLTPAKQHEAGLRYKFLGGRGAISAAYFFITQNNVQVPNPANLAFPPPNPLLPNLASDRVARGWEYEANIAFTKEFSVVANYTKFKNRDAFGNVFRGTAETSGAAFINYKATTAPLKGLGVGLGISYTGRRPGDAPTSGYAPGAFLNGQQVLFAPSFWIPAYYRSDLSLSYEFNRAITARFYIENLFDKKYIAGALNRNQVYFGADRNVYGSVTYSF